MRTLCPRSLLPCRRGLRHPGGHVADPLSQRIMAAAVVAVDSGFALRDRYALPKYADGPAIYLDWSSKHHVSLETSVILWRDASGHWQRDEATEVGPGLLPLEPKLQSHTVEPLAEGKERELERLIQDRRVYRGQPTPSLTALGRGFAGMEIRSRYGQATVVTYEGHTGPAAEIAKIAAGIPN
jgi:hypothetical protein